MEKWYHVGVALSGLWALGYGLWVLSRCVAFNRNAKRLKPKAQYAMMKVHDTNPSGCAFAVL